MTSEYFFIFETILFVTFPYIKILKTLWIFYIVLYLFFRISWMIHFNFEHTDKYGDETKLIIFLS